MNQPQCYSDDFCAFLFLDGEVPGSAVLMFDIELIGVEEGLPDGYMFVWSGEVSPNLFSEMDTNKDLQVDPTEVQTVYLCI